MNEKYNVYLISDSTGETLDRIFLSLQSQFKNFEYEKKEYFFVRTQQQVDKIISEGIKGKNPIILYTIVETKLAKQITKSLIIPTIGIGSSHHCDGQVLVLDDLIGLNETKIKFVKKFGNIKKNIRKAVNKFKKEVLSKKYPTKKYSY